MWSFDEWRNLSQVVSADGEVDKCNVYDVNYTLAVEDEGYLAGLTFE